jgi:hypothetical protein
MEIKELQTDAQWSYGVLCYIHLFLYLSLLICRYIQAPCARWYGTSLTVEDLVKFPCALVTTVWAPVAHWFYWISGYFGVRCQRWMVFHEPIFFCFSIWAHKPVWFSHYWLHLLALLCVLHYLLLWKIIVVLITFFWVDYYHDVLWYMY